MGRLLIILLVMLLPLRGWSTGRMAIQMTQGPQLVEIAGEPASMAGMPADCPLMAQAAPDAEKSATPSKNYSVCLTCQLCMSLAAQEFSALNLMANERKALPLSVVVSFISADLTRQAKPPIL